jgi:type I restriction enzyme S subunit
VRPNLRHYGLLKGKLENVLVSTAFAVIRSKCKLISNELIYMWITDETNLSYLQGVAEMSKATYPSIVPDDILNLRIAIPDTNSQDFVCINKLFIDIFDAIAVIHKENDLLSQCLVLQQTKLSKN